MLIQKTEKLRPCLAIVVFIMAGYLLSAMIGCGKSYGRFPISSQVEQAFENGSVQTGYRYYYAGREDIPYAIMGIDQKYQVISNEWISFAPDPAKLKKMAKNIYYSEQDAPYGAHIVSPNGEVVGVWYSNVFNRSVTVDEENRTVTVRYRNPDLEQRLW